MLSILLYLSLLAFEAIFALPAVYLMADSVTLPINHENITSDLTSSTAVDATHAVDQGALRARELEGYLRGYLCRPRPLEETLLAGCYVEKSTSVRYGWQQRVSPDTNCLASKDKACKIETKYEYTASQSYTFSVGINIDASVSKGVFSAGASASISEAWSWSKSQATGSVSGFELVEGEQAFIAFWPKIRESCGELSLTPYTPVGRIDDMIPAFGTLDGQINDPHACGITPFLLANGQPDGIFSLCHTGGTRKGQGCAHPALND